MWLSLYAQHNDGPFTTYKQEVTLVLFETALLDRDMRSACTLFLRLLAHSRTFPLEHALLVAHVSSCAQLAFSPVTRKYEVPLFTALAATPLPAEQDTVLKHVWPDVLALVSLSPSARLTREIELSRGHAS